MAKILDSFHIFAFKIGIHVMKLVLLSILSVAIAAVLLGVRVLFVKGGRFPSSHVHASPALRSRGIGCATASEASFPRKRH